MANVQRYVDPFGDIFDDLFRGFLVRPVMAEGGSPIAQRMKVEVREEGDGYKVLADVPGVKKEDIQVTIDGDQVSITAEVRQEKEARENGGRVLHTERYYGKLGRSFRLDHEVDQAKAKARYADGVLELTLPKKVTESVRRLDIQ